MICDISYHLTTMLFYFPLSRSQCLTFIPLRTEPMPPAARRTIAIGLSTSITLSEHVYFFINFYLMKASLSLLLYACISKQWTSSTPLTYKWHEYRFAIAEDGMRLTRKTCKYILICSLMIMILVVQSHLIDTCFVKEIRGFFCQ